MDLANPEAGAVSGMRIILSVNSVRRLSKSDWTFSVIGGRSCGLRVSGNAVHSSSCQNPLKPVEESFHR